MTYAFCVLIGWLVCVCVSAVEHTRRSMATMKRENEEKGSTNNTKVKRQNRASSTTMDEGTWMRDGGETLSDV